MTLTQLGTASDEQPEERQDLSEHEDEQSEAAFAAVLRDAVLPDGTPYYLPEELHSAARSLFRVGWVYGVRSGHTGPALANVRLPVSAVRDRLGEVVAAALGTGLGRSRVLQKVSYHGSLREHHGRYWVTGIEERVTPFGCVVLKYELSTWTGAGFRCVVSNVNARSVSGLPEYFDR
ncbi:hypothetical protein ACIBCO_40470 [Streptomyces violascens]|uniref:hypothetical protein n=1 Tax=Streptomyces violascens TaxID=67381 RepID=UPI0037A5C8D3